MVKIGGELNLRSLRAPLPKDRIEKALQGLPKGTALQVVATDPGSVADMAAFSRSTGHEILDQSAGGGEFAFVLVPSSR